MSDGSSVRPLWPPLVAGLVLGLVLILTFVLVGNGVGASGTFASIAAWLGMQIAPAATQSNGYLGGMVANGANPFASWIVVEVVGVAIGALLAAVSAGRFKLKVDTGAGKIGVWPRLVLALIGGALAGFGSRLAAGCTSGVGLSGTTMLGIGGFIFLAVFFFVGLGLSALLRRVW
ncbi:MAG: YeeE/YedE family protein [Halothiobacillus sp.]|nr:YeeE/YedE family protein [Halothiobacillus sp.]